MRTLLVAAVAATLAAGPAFSQSSEPANPAPPVGPNASSTAPTGADLARARSTEEMKDKGDHREGAHEGRPPPPRASHFRIRARGIELDVKCAEDEPTKACVDAITQMIDRLAATRFSRQDDGGRDFGRRSDHDSDDRGEDSDSHL